MRDPTKCSYREGTIILTPRLKRAVRVSSLLALSIFSSCLKPSADEDTSIPIVIAGGGRYTITPENGRARCSFQESGSLNYLLDCRAMVWDEELAREVPALSTAPGVNLDWNTVPIRIAGADITGTNFLGNASDLAVQYKVTLAEKVGTEVEIALGILRPATNTAVQAKERVLLPLAVNTYGTVSTIPLQLNVHPDPVDPSKTNVAYSTQQWDPLSLVFNTVSSACGSQGKIYFAADQSVYVLDQNKVRFFAGSANQSALANQGAATRFSVFLGANPLLACTPDSLFVASRATNQIFQIGITTEKLQLLVGSATGDTSSPLLPMDRAPAFSGIVAQGDGTLFFSDSRNRVVWRRKAGADGLLDVFMPRNGTLIPGPLALSPSGELYVSHDGIFERLNPADRTLHSLGENIPGYLAFNYGKISHLSFTGSDQILVTAQLGLVASLISMNIRTGANQVLHTGTNLRSGFGNGEDTIFSSIETDAEGVTSGYLKRMNRENTFFPLVGINSLSYRHETNVSAQTAHFGNPRGLAFDSAGNLLAYDAHYAVLKTIDPTGKIKRSVGGLRGGSMLQSFAADPSGTVYFSGLGGAIRNTVNGVWYLKEYTPVNPTEMDQSPILVTNGGDYHDSDDVTFAGGEGKYTAVAVGPRHPTRGKVLYAASIFVGPRGPSRVIAPTFINVHRIWMDEIPVTKETTLISLVLPATSAAVENVTNFIYGMAVANDGTIFVAQQAPAKIYRVKWQGGATPSAQLLYSAPTTPSGQSRYGQIALDPAGKLYVVDSGRGQILRLNLTGSTPATATISGPPTVFFGGNGTAALSGATSCGQGVLEVKGSSETIESQFHATLASVCAGTPVGIALRSTCGAPDGRLQIAFSQNFSETTGPSGQILGGTTRGQGNIVYITKPCESQ